MTGDILLGVVLGAHGLGGEVRVKAFTEFPERLSAYGSLHTQEGRVLEIATARAAKSDGAIVRFKGIDNRTAAEALTNVELLVARNALPATEPDEFYHADLIGLRVLDREGRIIGEISAIHNHGAGDVIEILRGDGGTLLLPFAKDFVPHIDLADKSVVVTEPEDDEAEEARGVE
ncbi:MAG TPA: ribosome maturation factor RimM [Rhizomicrobium sp.]|jgi:16S rRNA processing protein RimM|nr:ribosome maturation factor RimM [Rhizomicrobium sp.]